VVPNGSGLNGPIQIFGDKCLDVTDGVDADGTKLQIWTCDFANANQRWIPVSGSTITWFGENKCVDLTDGNLTDGNQAQIWDCDVNNSNQKWNPIAVTTPKTFSIALRRDPSLCVAASANAANASVVVKICNPADPAQTWSDPQKTGQVVVFGSLCMSPAGSVNDGTKLVALPCAAGNAAQQWSHETGIINNHNSPKSCLDLTDSVDISGTQLQTWTCSLLTSTVDNTNQDWVVTDTF